VTASTIISIISAVLAVARFLVAFAEKQKWMEAGAAEEALKGLKDADAAVAAANQAREAVRTDIARNPERLRDDDDFRRSD
jgi:hypothetical protein